MSLAHQDAGGAGRRTHRAWLTAHKPGARRLLNCKAGHVALHARRLVGVIALNKARPAVVYLLTLAAHAAMTAGLAAWQTSRSLAMAARGADSQRVRVYSARAVKRVGVYTARAVLLLQPAARTVAAALTYGALAFAFLAWRASRFLILHSRGRRVLEIGLTMAVIWLLFTPRAPQSQPVATGAAQSVALVRAPTVAVPTVPDPPGHSAMRHGTDHPRTPLVPRQPSTPVAVHRDVVAKVATLSGRMRAPATGRACPRPAAPLPPPGPCGDVWRRAEQPNPDARLTVPPSVSVHAIWHALWAAGSPLAATSPRRDGKTYAEYLWDEGKVVGIDPAVVMGIFRHESGYGTLGMARLTHSVGNIRPVGLQPEICAGDGCYAYANDWFDGIDRIYSLLRQYALHGATTVDQVIPIWAPPSDYNDDAAYIAGVRETMRALHAAG